MIELINVRKRFDSRWITNGVTLTIPQGKMTVIIGRSGEGKSVLLKQIIGLIKPTSGQIFIDGIDATKIHNRDLIFKKVGYVFQAAALLDSLTIFENIGLPLLERGMNPQEVLPIVKEKLALVNLTDDTLYKYPSELSGGMQKRIGLARTLVHNPQIMLYDEPTTGLDPVNSRIVHELMASMQKKLNLTSVIVSHDIDVFQYADYVALLQEGTIKYFDNAAEVWNSNNPDLYRFIRGLTKKPAHQWYQPSA
jgi:phospholipid/cholesterol/gamma-HCH transport system ATP-binding protein